MTRAEKRNRRARGIWLCALVFWMALIFVFSSRPADVSTEDSHLVGRLIAMLAGGENWTEAQRLAFIESIDFYVRKAAHATEYAVLGILLSGTFRSFGVKGRRAMAYAFCGAVLYASVDEIHQYFVPGRANRIFDVMVDSCGAVFGIAAARLAEWIKKWR